MKMVETCYLVEREWNLKLAFHRLMVHQGAEVNVVLQIKTVISENLNILR